VIAAAGAAALVGIIPSVRIVSTAEVELVEKLGKYNRQLRPGFHLLFPFVERVSFKGTTREQVIDIPPKPAITSDNAPLSVDAVVYWRIVDPVKARYEVNRLVLSLQNLVTTQLRSEVGKLTLDQTFSARQQINAALLDQLNGAADKWGIEVIRVELQSIMPNAEILKSMELQMSAERKKRAEILASEGLRTSQVNKAEGEADAVRLEAQAQAEAVQLRAAAESRRLELESEGAAKSLRILADAAGGNVDAAMQVLLLSKYWETQSALAESDNTKVLFYPSKATVPLTFEGLRDLVQSE